VIIDPADGRIPYQPAAAARRRELLADIFTPTRPEHVDPHVRATLDGVPATITSRVACKSARAPDMC
jgi:hypothetical protein